MSPALRRAALTVCAHATDADDARDLLAALGIDPTNADRASEGEAGARSAHPDWNALRRERFGRPVRGADWTFRPAAVETVAELVRSMRRASTATAQVSGTLSGQSATRAATNGHRVADHSLAAIERRG